MRILHVCDSYLPRLGGIELHVRDLSGYQRAAGDEVTVATLAAGSQEISDSVVRLPNLGTFPHPRALAELTRMIADGRYDVVHAHSSLVSPLAWCASRAAAAWGTPAVLTMHSMLPTTGLAAAALRAWLPWPPAAIALTAVSTAAAASLRGALPEHDVSVLPNGIDPQVWARPGAESPPRPLTIVSVMRLARRKRPLQLLDVLEAIRRQTPAEIPLQAVLVGSGPLAGAINRKLASSGMGSWVSCVGSLSRSEIREQLHHSDLYLAPATLESFGIAALEARCAGLPVIGMECGGVRDFIDDGTEGFLVDSDAEMATRAASLLTDGIQLQQISNHNRTNAPAITWPRVLEMHVQTYVAAGAPSPTEETSRTQPLGTSAAATL